MRSLLLFGDSITAGQYIKPSARFTEKMRRFLWENSLEVNLDVQAVSGQTSRQALIRFPDLINEYRVDVLLVQLGINDANYWKSEGGLHPRVSLNSFRENILELISRAKLAGVEQIRLLTNHTTNKIVQSNLETFDLHSLVSPYNHILREIATDAVDEVSLYDVEREWLMLSPEDREASLIPNDGVHLSEFGHMVYFRILKDFLLNDEELNFG